MQRYWRSIK